jgi:isopenicillin N synthase-like dioxygenase
MNVQVCDLKSDTFEQTFMDSILNTGFAVLVNHGIDPLDIKHFQDKWRKWFLRDQESKKMYQNFLNPNMGYSGFKSEKAVGANKADLKEFYHWRPGEILPFHALTPLYIFYNLEDIGLRVLGVLDRHWDIPNPGFQDCCLHSRKTILRTLYYPALDFESEKGAVRAAAHEDINYITLLVAASAPGLEVKDAQGNWHPVPHEENSVICNIGDMLQLASGGKYKSTTHRVVNPENSSSDRISMPMFIHPHENTVLADGITAKSFLAERIAKINTK